MMSISVNIDVGGTFTEAVLFKEGRIANGKVPTVYHDVSLGVLKSIREAAKEVGLSTEDLLKDTSIIRYSTTLALNALVQRKGPKLGFITTRGFEHMIYIGRAYQWGEGLPSKEQRVISRGRNPEPIIPYEMVASVSERIDYKGRVVLPLSREEILGKVRYLVDRGARGFAVCLLFSWRNPVHERMIKECILEEYPEAYLGNVPVLLSSEVHPKWKEYPRAMATILTAYVHSELSGHVGDLITALKRNGYRGPLMLAHATGGVARAARTRAIDTYNAGPVAGLIGCAYIAHELYGEHNIISTEVGGTTFNTGVIVQGRPQYYDLKPVIDRWAIGTTMLECKSIGAGGGSISWINEALGNRLEVGPSSAGAMPGPACYDQGGTEPTVTDADVVLGYINPDNFLGGRIQLSREKACEAIREKIAKPLGLKVEDAAWAVKRVMDTKMGEELYNNVTLKGHDPRKFTVFAFGGAGGTHCCGYSAALKTSRIYVTPINAVFGAFSLMTLDISHLYEHSINVKLFDPSSNEYYSDFTEFNSLVDDLQERATKDFNAEGLGRLRVVYNLDLDIRLGSQPETLRISSPKLTLEGREDVITVVEKLLDDYSKLYLVRPPPGTVKLENMALRASIPRNLEYRPPTFNFVGEDPSGARAGTREVYWERSGGFEGTAIYSYDRLKPGNMVLGPTVVEEANTTIVVPEGWRMTMDKYRYGILERV